MPPHNQQKSQQQQRQEAPPEQKQETTTEVEAATPMPEKINTKVATPQELFESKLITLLDLVLRRRLEPASAVRELHAFWREELTAADRESLIDNTTESSNVIQAGRRLSDAANMLGTEMHALIASHQNSKGF